MALPQYSTAELIANIKRRCSIPTSQLTYTNADFTLLANDEMQGEVVPLVMSTREEYFVAYEDVTVPATGIIDLPEHAVGAKLRSACFVIQTNPLVLVNIPRIDLDVVAGVGSFNLQTSAGFYLQGNQLILGAGNVVPTNRTVRLYFYKRTLVLATPTEYGQVVSVDANTNTVVLSRVPTDWEIGTELNAVSAVPNFQTTSELATIVTVSAPTLELDSVEGISVGDYVSEYGFSAVPQIPLEAHAYLAQLTAVTALQGLGAPSDKIELKAAMLRKNLLTMISQRVDGSIKKVVNPAGGLRMNSGLWRPGGLF